MEYQVLARKWRPKSFSEVVGQEVILQVLTNTLSLGRLHHAYLFSGTHGVGKTSLGRLLAKCINCKTGITATPCNQCEHCYEIDQGKFIDLIEIDAASRTKVDDTRELLENVPYSPAKGRYKVYLIDEVHMLSGHSFNALLKTLEEPPEHVKFILATTDPQKLPVTIHSRCLQLHLSLISAEKIAKHLAHILKTESIKFEEDALNALSHAAHGSMRDALSLLDQAIAFCGGKVTQKEVDLMLGNIGSDTPWLLLSGLSQQDPNKILETLEAAEQKGEDLISLIDAFLTAVHAIAIQQHANQITIKEYPKEIEQCAKCFSKEDIQLFYDIATKGKETIKLAPSARLGAEMVFLRLLSFYPMNLEGHTSPSKSQNVSQNRTKIPDSTQQNAPKAQATPIGEINQDVWEKLVENLSLVGVTAALARNCSVVNFANNKLELTAEAKHAPFISDRSIKQLSEALTQHEGKKIVVTIQMGQTQETPHKRQVAKESMKHDEARDALMNDQILKEALTTFDATLDESTIQLIEEK